MMFITPGLYLRIEETKSKNAPVPRPLENGFSMDKAYLALGAWNASETSECYFIISNDDDQVWMISNRHLRTHTIFPNATAFRMQLGGKT